MKKTAQITTDILMSVLLLVCFAVPWTGVLCHERLGMLLFILVILHNAFHFRWYQTLFSGPYNARRTVWAAVNLLLLASLILTAVSGVMISRYVFVSLNLDGSFFWRKIHLCSSYWGLILTGMHAGLHFPPAAAVKRIPSLPRRAFCAVLFAGGLYACFALTLWQKLLFLETFSAPAGSASAGALLHVTAAGFFALLTRFFFFKNLTNK